MAKSKKKSNKSTKARKQTTRAQQKPKQVVVDPRADKSVPIFAGLMISFVVALFIGGLLIVTAEDKSIKSSAKPTLNPNSQQTIEVTKPNAEGTPGATGVQLQGSSPVGQEAQGGLQKPQNGDQLQPNAKIKNYENAELN